MVTRDSVPSIALGLLALLALGVGAATLTSPVVVAGDGFGFGDWGFVTTESDADTGAGIPLEFPTGGGGEFVGPCLTWLRTPVGMLAVALLVLVPAGYVSYRTRWLLPGIAIVGAFGGPVFLLWTVLGSCASGEFLSFDLPISDGSGIGGGGGGGLAGVVTVAARQPSILFGFVLAVAIVAAVALLVLSTGNVEDEDDEEDPEDRPADAPDVAAIGAAAGRAADRLSVPDADLENEVYRAWASMTDHLAVSSPRTSTPAEFADAAVSAGMRADDVAELTGLFEAVRYGGESATGSREAQAVAALRRIEEGYGGRED
jgi:hypothetical protein